MESKKTPTLVIIMGGPISIERLPPKTSEYAHTTNSMTDVSHINKNPIFSRPPATFDHDRARSNPTRTPLSTTTNMGNCAVKICVIFVNTLLSICSLLYTIFGLIWALAGSTLIPGPKKSMQMFDEGSIATLYRGWNIRDSLMGMQPIFKPVGTAITLISASTLAIAIFGLTSSIIGKKVYVKIYIVLVTVMLTFHTSLLAYYMTRPDILKESVKSVLLHLTREYISYSNMDPSSFLLSAIQHHYRCCGTYNGSDFKHSTNLKAEDFFGKKAFKNLKYPIFCCMHTLEEFNTMSCPTKFTDWNSYKNFGCVTLLHGQLKNFTDKLAHGSALLISLDILVIPLSAISL